MTLTKGTLLAGRYELDTLIGSGGMAQVFRAHDTALGRQVAVKVLHSGFAGDSQFMARFSREAQTMALLNHPNIVAVYDLYTQEECPFLVEELIEGEDLRMLLAQEKTLPLPKALDIIEQVLDALGYAHSRGVIHRDIKPHNLMLTPEGRLKVTDFGIAKVAEGRDVTQTGEVIGTAKYMAPEQLQNRPGGPSTDLYSTAIVLYELLSGSTPFDGDTMAIAYAQVHDPPAPLSRRVKNLPPHIERVIMQALSKVPAERYASALEMKQALIGEQTQPVGVLTTAFPVLGKVGGGPKRLRSSKPALAVLGILLLLGLGSFAFARNSKEAAPTDSAGSAKPATQPAPPSPPSAAKMVRLPSEAEIHLYFERFAVEKIQKIGLKPVVVYETSTGIGSGSLWKLDPPYGSEVPEGSEVKLYIQPGASGSQGQEPRGASPKKRDRDDDD